MKTADRVFGWLMILGTCLHTVGTISLTKFMSDVFVWSLGASIAGFLLGALNLVRAGRPADKTLAYITVVGTFLWAMLAVTFGVSIGNVFDPRVITNVIISAALVFFCIRSIRAV